MRVVLANPHSYIYGKTVLNSLLGRKDFMKYRYFIDEYLRNDARDAAVYVDGSRSSFQVIGIPWFLLPKPVVYVEVIIWMLLNGVNPLKTKIYTDVRKLDAKNDILVDFARSFGNAGSRKSPGLLQFEGLSLVFFTHYIIRAETIAKYLADIPHALVAAENDLIQEPYFRKFFPDVSTVYQLPFAIGERYVMTKNFSERLNKCLAVGSMSAVDDPQFIDFFGSPILHPMRASIAEQAREYPEILDSRINPLLDPVDARKNLKISPRYQALTRYVPYVLLEKIFGTRQSDYFKFDIVEQFNRYKMFICPEEIAGLPSINAFEGMACGSAFIGIDDPMYTNLGLIPGTHYISYQKGDFHDLIAKIRYYQERPEELESIAKAGKQFVEAHFSRPRVAQVLWEDLEKMSRHFQVSGEVKVMCGFKK